MTAHISENKKQVVAEFVKLIKSYPIIGLVNMEGLPAKQLQRMRERLRDTVVIKMTKGRLIKVAFDECKDIKGIEELKGHMKGMPAMIFTKDNPFRLFKILEKNKSSALAKAGQIAPNDIIVPAGPTGFAPGPVIGELGAIGIKAGIENGKVAIKADAVVAKEGDEIKENVAGILSRLGIEPMEVGLDLIAVLENGAILTKDVLHVDEDEIRANFEAAAQQAFNLAIEVAYPCTETTELLITKAFSEAKALAIETKFVSKETIQDLLGLASREGSTIKEIVK